MGSMGEIMKNNRWESDKTIDKNKSINKLVCSYHNKTASVYGSLED